MAAQPAMGRSGPQPMHDQPAKTGGCRTFLPAAFGLGIAIILFGLGTMMSGDAKFADQYVARQLSEQRITFKAADALTPDERQTPCLVEHAGKPLITGEQAECYANHFIARHLKAVAGGQTYSQLREVQTTLRGQIATAQANNDAAVVADLQRQLTDVTAKRQTLFEGETVRGLLLTSFGFSTLGDRAALGATISFTAAGVATLLSAGLLGWTLSRPRPEPMQQAVATASITETPRHREMANTGARRVEGRHRPAGFADLARSPRESASPKRRR